MLCEFLNIPLCSVCLHSINSSRLKLIQSKCWVQWWQEELNNNSNNMKSYLKSIIETEGFEGYYFIYLTEAIKLYYPEYSEWLEKMTLLI